MRDSKGRFSKAKARPFKVGDRIEGLRWHRDEPTSGTVTEFAADGDPYIESPYGGALLKRHTCRLLEPAPQPKAEDLPLTFIQKAQDGAVIGKAYGKILDDPAKDAEIATLKAEVERLKKEAEER